MLGFSPLAGSTIGGSGVVREVVLANVTGVQSSATLGVISLSTDATISDQAVRKPGTTFFYDPNADGIGILRPNEYVRYNWVNSFILGMRDQIPLGTVGADYITIGPFWDEAVTGDNALSLQTKLTAELTSDPIVSQSSWAPLVNGDYTYPATYVSDLGYGASGPSAVTVYLNHLPSESIVSNAATISTIDDPLLVTLTFPASDPDLFGVVVGQVRTINTFDTTNTDTYFDSLITSQLNEVQWPSENKHFLLQKYDTDKGFFLGTLRTTNFQRNKAHPFLGAAHVEYGFRLQPQITAANFPDGTPVSQEHTLLVTSSLGTIKPNISKELPALPITVGTNLGITPAVTSFVEGFDLTAGLPDPQWYLSTSRVEIIAEPNQPANDVIYPYASRSPTAGATQTDFDFTVSLGVLAGPIAVDQPVDGYDATLTLGTPTVRTFNFISVASQVVTLGSNLSGVVGQPTEIIDPSDSILITSSLGSITTLAESKAVCTSILITHGLGNITFAANANTAPSGSTSAITGSVGDVTFTGDANTFPDGLELIASVGIAGIPAKANIDTAGFVTVTIGAVGVGAGKLVSGFGIDVQFNTDITATGFKFDFEAIKHLYNVLRQVHGGFPANRTARPTFSSPRKIRPPKPSKNLAA